MEFITVFNWDNLVKYEHNINELEYQHGDQFTFTEEKQNQIVNYFLSKEYSVMIKKYKDSIFIFFSNIMFDLQ